MPRRLRRVDGVLRPYRQLPVLHRHEEQQSDDEEEAQYGESVENSTVEQQIPVHDFVLDAGCEQSEIEHSSASIVLRENVLEYIKDLNQTHLR